jgi:uncharacterized membrane-anchored protein YitT (DUF2179 family)
VRRATHHGIYLLIFTALLVTIGCFLYAITMVGLAQFFWVLASGTAGASIVLFMEHR